MRYGALVLATTGILLGTLPGGCKRPGLPADPTGCTWVNYHDPKSMRDLALPVSGWKIFWDKLPYEIGGWDTIGPLEDGTHYPSWGLMAYSLERRPRRPCVEWDTTIARPLNGTLEFGARRPFGDTCLHVTSLRHSTGTRLDVGLLFTRMNTTMGENALVIFSYSNTFQSALDSAEVVTTATAIFRRIAQDQELLEVLVPRR